VRRRLVTLAAAASLLLCIATVALWVRSYWVSHFAARYDGRGGYLGAISSAGSFHLVAGSKDKRNLKGYYFSRPGVWPSAEVGGITTFRLSFREGLWITFPHWIVCAVTALLFALFTRSLRAHRHGSCSSCGYDLRATPDRCPECGAAPASTAAR
jgi:hypothetical protein